MERNTSLFGPFRVEFPAGIVTPKNELEELALVALVANGQATYADEAKKPKSRTTTGEE